MPEDAGASAAWGGARPGPRLPRPARGHAAMPEAGATSVSSVLEREAGWGRGRDVGCEARRAGSPQPVLPAAWLARPVAAMSAWASTR